MRTLSLWKSKLIRKTVNKIDNIELSNFLPQLLLLIFPYFLLLPEGPPHQQNFFFHTTMTHFNTSSHYKDTKKEKKGPKEGKKGGLAEPIAVSDSVLKNGLLNKLLCF